MKTIYITPDRAALAAEAANDGQDDGPAVAGFYCYDGEYHGPFADRDEAEDFVADDAGQRRLDERHNASLRYPGC